MHDHHDTYQPREKLFKMDNSLRFLNEIFNVDFFDPVASAFFFTMATKPTSDMNHEILLKVDRDSDFIT